MTHLYTLNKILGLWGSWPSVCGSKKRHTICLNLIPKVVCPLASKHTLQYSLSPQEKHKRMIISLWKTCTAYQWSWQGYRSQSMCFKKGQTALYRDYYVPVTTLMLYTQQPTQFQRSRENTALNLPPDIKRLTNGSYSSMLPTMMVTDSS